MRKDAIIRAFVERQFLVKVSNFFKERIVLLPSKLSIGLLRLITPVKDNRIIFITFRGEYDCNAKWIAEELRKRNPAPDIIWTVQKNAQISDIPAEFTLVQRSSYNFFRYLASSKIIVDNGISTVVVGYKKKKNQVLVETWHGSIGIKMFSRETNHDKQWCRNADREGTMTDYCLSNSTFEDKIYTDTFWKNANILQLGHARNDVLCWKDSERLNPIRQKVFEYFNFKDIIEQLKQQRHAELALWYQEKLGTTPVTAGHLGHDNPFDHIDIQNKTSMDDFMRSEYTKCEDLRICLYAPTFRDDGDMRPYEIDYDKLRHALHTRFGGSWIIMTRFHFRLRKKLKKYKLPLGVIDASGYPDIQELLTCINVGITDYSSWICDYMLTRKPGFLFATDMTEYEKKDREFFYPLDSMPFPLALNNEQLIQNILNFDNDVFVKECDAFLKDKGCMDDGHSAQRIADAIERIIEGELV